MEEHMPVSSSLSPSRSDSSNASFATAIQTPHKSDQPKVASDEEDEPVPSYCEAIPLRRELESQCQILIEEQLYSKAIFMLNQTLLSSQAREDGLKPPVHAAPPAQLALLSTITVHPHRTTRLKERDDLAVVADSWTYLRNLLSLAGPINADLKTAFRFRGVYRSHRQRRAVSGEDGHDGIDNERIYNKYDNEESLFHQAEDLWHVFGWGFNCSILYPHRWRYWKLWLEYMLDALEADWNWRQHMDEESESKTGQKCLELRRESLLMMYVKQDRAGRTRLTRVLKAIFADGKELSRRFFHEVFHNEHRLLKGDGQRPSDELFPTHVDVDNGEYGGYVDFTDSDEDVEGSPQKTPRTPRHGVSDDMFRGTVDSMPLRLRLFVLLSIVADALPSELSDLSDLHAEFAKQLREQPVQVFQHYITRMRDWAAESEPPEFASIVADVLVLLLDGLLPSASKHPYKAGDSVGDRMVRSARSLTCFFLPWPAATDNLEDNARVALLLEAALASVPPADLGACMPDLREAAVRGIEARGAVVKKSLGRPESTRRRGRPSKKAALGGNDTFLRETIELAGQRILLYIDCMTDTAGSSLET
ncbi:hypothetical protein SODALDRAFT_304413 [Sodiomyces alkalinus F11]|uniref:Uncharacterized protein n=1 Tax=Sodiomyces alkalinus (strain CBS 110278 / VKM F-3762 / F11) TaxID=1314773 RepID=A0A3N2Q7Q9_SODAK|nr:hypothetical protein SODALDRAFT_304413 [Sodiomyces alkalinus F11]ROT42811.1 hypothetical protein SODALDRAFT_304413 [Sodiomyces alkalinus F11]